jgi:hypothetical protein
LSLQRAGGRRRAASDKSKSMSNGEKSEQKPRSQAEIRQERLAAELRSNLQKRKQQARGRVAAARQVDKQNSSD